MPRLPLDRPACLEGTFQDNLRPSLSLEGVRAFMCSWNPLFFSSAAAVSNSWRLRGVEKAPGGIINRTKHPKRGQVPSSFPFPPDWWQLFRRKNLHLNCPFPLLGFPFHSWPRFGVYFSSVALHLRGGKCITKPESPGQGWYFPLSPFCISEPSLSLRCLGSSSGQKEERRSVGLIWLIVYGRLPNFRWMAICYITWSVFWYCNLN